jgi:Cu2+-containing amine oxidase
MKSTYRTLLGLCLATTVIIPAMAQNAPPSRPSSVLSLEEHARAVQIAAPQATSRAFQLDPNAARPVDAPDREVVSNVQAVGKTSDRRAMVTLYRYDGNVAVNRLIDIDSGRVIQDTRLPGGAAPVAPVETEYATMLLRNNEQVRQLLAAVGDDATFLFRLATTTEQGDANFGKRVVRASISTPNGYVGGAPTILVNLTDGSVSVGQ